MVTSPNEAPAPIPANVTPMVTSEAMPLSNNAYPTINEEHVIVVRTR